MLSKLALQNIRQKKFRSLLASLSITIGTASLVLFLGLSNGIQSATFEEIEKANPLTQITVRPNTENTGLLSFITQSDEGKLNQENIDQISKISGVKDIYPEIQFNNFASIEANLLGFDLMTDSMIFGVPLGFIEKDIKDPKAWERETQPYPTVIPSKLLDMYNLSIASPQGLPLISEQTLIGKELLFYPNYSSFFPGLQKKTDPIKLEVLGFSSKINLIGATLPYKVVEKFNNEYTNTDPSQTTFIELYVETETPNKTQEVAEKIEELGFKTQYFQKNLKDIEAKFAYLSISLGTISLIILLTAAIAIISTFLATIAERTKEIGLFRALGATKSHIKKLILLEAGMIGIFGSLLGTGIGLVSSVVVDNYALEQLKNTTFSPDSLFLINIPLILAAIIFGTILSIISAYLPAHKASKINPIEALNK